MVVVRQPARVDQHQGCAGLDRCAGQTVEWVLNAWAKGNVSPPETFSTPVPCRHIIDEILFSRLLVLPSPLLAGRAACRRFSSCVEGRP